MEELTISPPVNRSEVETILLEMAATIDGAKVEGLRDEALLLHLPTIHRFYTGEARVEVSLTTESSSTTIRIEIDLEELHLTQGGRVLLVTGALGVIPWILWPFFPSLMPLIPMGVLFLFLAWLAVGRRPHTFTEEMVTNRLLERLSGNRYG